jgi:uncharacterized protein (DUF2461 family)
MKITDPEVIRAERAAAKEERDRYREAARQQLGDRAVSPQAHVHPMADGAFVEVTIWIPRSEVQTP